MSDEERRTTPILTDSDVLRIRDVIRQELEAAQGNGDLLNTDERKFVREWIDTHQVRRKFLMGVGQTVTGSIVVAIVLGIGAVVWRAFISEVKK